MKTLFLPDKSLLDVIVMVWNTILLFIMTENVFLDSLVYIL